jgi:hypothetical protein
MIVNWKIIEKVIGAIQLIWGVCFLFITVWSIKLIFDSVFGYYDYSLADISISKIIKNYHYQILLPTMTIFAGLALILKKKIGWLIGIVTSAIYSISIILLPLTIENENIEDDSLLYVYILTGLISFIFTIILCLLLTKRIRTKYNPTSKNWVIISFLFVVLVLDKLFIK